MLMIALVVLSVLAILIVCLFGYAATRPGTFRVARNISIDAPPQKVFPYINNLHRQLTWIPFDRDPAAKRSFSSNIEGKGASYAWDGNKDVGAGRIEIVDTTEPSKVTMKLDMIKPMKAHNLVEFSLDPGERRGTTKVTWAMHGPASFLGKLVSVFIDCEKMCGNDFEKGLAKLKALAEESPSAASQVAR
jgi:uncharacterized protein YndB with AHSA1/START domain